MLMKHDVFNVSLVTLCQIFIVSAIVIQKIYYLSQCTDIKYEHSEYNDYYFTFTIFSSTCIICAIFSSTRAHNNFIASICSSILSLILLSTFCNAQSLSVEGVINCGDVVDGETTKSDNTHYYLLNVYNDSIYLFADSCESNYDSDIYLYDENMDLLIFNDFSEWDDCGKYQSHLFYGPLSTGMYIVAITGFEHSYGNYSMEIYCTSADTDTYFVSRNGVDTEKCGTKSNPCGTLYQASLNINNRAYIFDEINLIYVMDGQNESAISRHLILNDTFGYDPCLPMPFKSSKNIEINFNSSEIYNSDQWLPPNICDYQNNSFKNIYIFDGGKTLTMNNLVINNYSHYPFIRNINSPHAEILCNHCTFTNISSISYPLIHTRSNVFLSNTKFININAKQTLIYADHEDYEFVDRIIVVINTIFNNIKSDGCIVNISRSFSDLDSDNSVFFDGCNFMGIDIANAAIYDETYQSKVTISNANIDIISGAFYYSEHALMSTINITNVSIISYHLEENIIFHSIFYFSATDITNMELIDIIYSYNMSESCQNAESYDSLYICKNPTKLIQNDGELNLNYITIDGKHFDDLPTYLVEYEVSVAGFIKNIGIMNIEHLIISRTICSTFIVNEGILTVIDLSFTTSFIDTYNPNALHSSRIIVQIGRGSSIQITQSSFIGSYYILSITAGLVDILDCEFSRGNIGIQAKNADPLLVNNCTFINMGQYYGRIPLAYAIQSIIQIWHSNNMAFSHNQISTFEPDGFLYLEKCTNVSIFKNAFSIDATQLILYYPTAQLDHPREIVQIYICNNTKIVSNDFVDDKFGKIDAWIVYSDNIGLNCLSGNKFSNRALTVWSTNITSCARPNIIRCTHDNDNSCIKQINGYIDEKIIDSVGYFMMDTYNKSESVKHWLVLDAYNSHIVLDNIQILGDSNAARAFVFGNPSKILLIDALITINLTYYPNNHGRVLYEDVLFNNTQYVSAILFDLRSYNSSLQHKLNYVYHSSPMRLFFNSYSTSYYPGKLLKFQWNITDRFGNHIDIVENKLNNVTVTTQINGDAFSTELVINEAGECPLCETGVLINDISIEDNIGDVYHLNLKILDSVLILYSSTISLNITGCPARYGSDSNNFTCTICETNHYNLHENNVENCKSCDINNNPAITCFFGNILISKNHWMGINEQDAIISAACLSGYCCIKDNCDYIDDKTALCALNRDYESILCGKCTKGYSESLYSTKCVKCKRKYYFEHLLLPFFIALLISLFLMVSNTNELIITKSKSDDSHDSNKKVAEKIKKLWKNPYFKLMIQILILKNILYFEQAVAQVLVTSPFTVLFTSFASIFNLSLASMVNDDEDEDGLFCFIDGLNGKGKILVDLFMPAMIFLFIFITYSVSKFIVKKPLKFKNKKVNFLKTFIAMYLIIIGKILDILFRIMSCQQVGNDLTVHYYFSYDKCYGTSWILALIFLLIIIISFGLIFIKLKFMNISDRQNPDNILNQFVSRYKPQYYYWELVVFVRRVFIAIFAVSVSDILSKFFFLGIIMIFIQIQNIYNPFIINEGNRMEHILLLCLLFIIATQTSQAMDYTVLNVIVSFLIILPFPLLLYFAYTLFTKKDADKTKSEDINNMGKTSDVGGRSVELYPLQTTTSRNVETEY
eukprot:4628_1